MDIKRSKENDRKPSSTISGSPKKGGAGGKGTWGVGGLDDLKAVSIKDDKDPNYDSEEEEALDVYISKTEIATPIETLLTEYFSSGEVNDALKSLAELNVPDLAIFVKKAIGKAMEKQAFERELVSQFFLGAYNSIITPQQLEDGFQVTLDSLDDLVLDTPDAVDILSKFIARSIVDEILAPSFIKNAKIQSSLAEQCLSEVNVLVNQPFRSERLAHVWGPGDLHSVKRLKEESSLVFEEYINTGDIKEADKSIRELNAPHFHPQLVKQALRLALTKEEDEKRKKILGLLSFLSKEDLISKEHLKKGFTYCIESLDDLKLDTPKAPSILQGFVETAKSEGWLVADFKQISV